MAKIGTVAADFVARTTKFTEGVKKSRKAINRKRDSVNRLRRAMARATKIIAAFAAAGLAAAAGGIAALTRSGLQSVDRLAKMSDTVGIATEKLQALHEAGKLGGVGIEDVNKALIRMQRSVVDATDGLSTQVRALDKLGLSADELRNMSPDEQFKAIADAFKGLKNVSDRTNIAAAIFGRQGPQLIPLLQQGAEALNQIENEIDAVGISLSRVDAAKVEMANDAWTRAKRLIEAAKNQLAIGFAPALQIIAEKIMGATDGFGGLGNAVQKGVRLLVAGGGAVAEIWNGLMIAVDGVRIIALELFSGIASGLKWMLEQASSAADAIGFGGIARGAQDAADEIGYLADGALSSADDYIARIEERVRNAGKTAVRTLVTYDGMVAAINAQAHAAAKAAEGQEDIAAAAEAAADALEEQARQTEKLQSLADKIKESLKDPVAKLKDFMVEVQVLVMTGFLSQVEGMLAVAREAEKLGLFQRDDQENPMARAGAILRSGSAESQLATYQGRLGSMFDDDDKKLLDETKTQTDLLEQINIALSSQAAPTVVRIA